MNRAIWSAPPPDPAGTTNSTGLLGFQAFAITADSKTNAREQTKTTTSLNSENTFFMILPP
jgi:hypothetical protein